VIAVDAMGGDYAPQEIMAGALATQREHGVAVAANLARGEITEKIRERVGTTGERRAGHFLRRDR
jgi:fatty acid/phospholipid biosynthesis enzyme